MTAMSPDDFTFPLGDSDDTGGIVAPITNQANPFNLSDLSSTLPPSLIADDTEVSELYIEIIFLNI